MVDWGKFVKAVERENIEQRNVRAIKYLIKANPEKYEASYENGILTLFEKIENTLGIWHLKRGNAKSK